MKLRALAALAIVAIASSCLTSMRASADCPDWRGGPLGNGAANGADGTIICSTIWDPDGAGPLAPRLVVGGSFNSIEGVPAHHIAMRDPSNGHWLAIGNGFNSTPYALTVFNGELVAGGSGDNDPGTPDNNILHFDGTTWQTFNGGTSTGTVYALAVYNGELYAGGNFVIYPTPLDPAVNFAHWNTTAHLWEEIQSTFNEIGGTITSFLPWNGELLAAGSFTSAGASSSPHIARFNGSTWLNWGSGSDQAISALGIYNGNIAIGSSFPTPTGYSPTVGVWNGSGWTPLGGNYPHGVDNSINSIVNFGGTIYIGGYFTKANNVTVGHMAYYDGANWQAVGAGCDAAVYTMISYSSQLVVGGAFTHAGGQPANHLAQWNGTAWSSYGGGLANSVLAMTSFLSYEVAGGDFNQSLDVGQSAHYIAGWDGATLVSFGSGMDNPVFALKSFKYSGLLGNFELVAGGSFTHAGGIGANFIARWDVNPFSALPPPAWAAMGPGFSGPVAAIERYNNQIYAGGTFVSSGATSVNRIAKFNESTKLWEALGTGMNGPVYALKVFGTSLYAGGAFTTANGVSTGGLARWDGTNWNAVGGFFNGTVYALEVDNGVLAIGGTFPGINSSPNLAYYTGSTYGTYGTGGTSGAVKALHSTGSRLYAGGDFATINGTTVNHVAFLTFFGWLPMNGGTDNSVEAIGNYHNIVHVGGLFNNVRGGALLAESWAEYDETGYPQFKSNPFSGTYNIGDNVALTAVPDTGYTGTTQQWFFDGSPLSDGPTGHGSTITGSHSEVLNITNFQAGDVGTYDATVSNACGTTTSMTATLTAPAGVGDHGLPHANSFDGLAPNPARASTQLVFALAHDARVHVRVQDVAGRTIRGLDAGMMTAGQHLLRWDMRGEDGSTARPGVYFIGLEVDGKRLGTRTLAIVR